MELINCSLAVCHAGERLAMPVTVNKQQLSSLEDALRASIGGNKSSSDDLAKKLARQSRSILLQKIHFVPSSHLSHLYWEKVAHKYCIENTMNSEKYKSVVINGIHKEGALMKCQNKIYIIQKSNS